MTKADDKKFGKLPLAPWGKEVSSNDHAGKIWMTKNKVCIRILPEQEKKYTSLGYHRGMK